MDPVLPDGLRDEDALGQDLVLRLQVGRRETDAPAPGGARDDPSGDLVRPAEEGGGLVDAAASEEPADGRRADGPPAADGGGHEVDAHPGPPAELPQPRGVAAPVAAEAEIPADDHLAGAQSVPENALHELPAAQVGERSVEGDDGRGVDAGAAEPLEALGGRVDQQDRPLAERPFGVGLEGQDERAQAFLPGQGAQPRQDLAVAEVETVEVAHGHGGGAGEEAGVVADRGIRPCVYILTMSALLR